MTTNDKLAYIGVGLVLGWLVLMWVWNNMRLWIARGAVKIVYTLDPNYEKLVNTKGMACAIHTPTYDYLNNQINDLKNQLALTYTGKIKQNSSQLSFESIAPNGNRQKYYGSWPVYNTETGQIDHYKLEFPYLDWLKYNSEEYDYVWIERRMPPVGKRKDVWYKFMWIERDEFNYKTDRDVLKNFPNVREFDELPFKIIDVHTTSDQVSHSQLQLL